MREVLASRLGSDKKASFGEYGLALLLVALATAGRLLLDPYIEEAVPYITYFLGNAIVMRYTGFGPSLLAIGLSTVAADYFFLLPRHTLWSPPEHYVVGVVFMVANLIILRIAHNLRKTEQAAEANAMRMNRSQEIAHLGSWELDLLRNELTWSDEVYRIFGRQPQEFGATYEAFLEAVHPDDRKKVDEAYSGSVREGRDSYEIDHRIIRHGTGEVRYVHERCEHTRDAQGRIIRSVGMVQDITERKAAEEALQRSEERFRRLVEVSSQIVWLTNAEGQPEEDSPSWRAYTGRSSEQWKGWNWLEVIHPEDRERLAALWRRAIESRSTYECEFRMMHRSGEFRHVVARAVPMLNADGTVREWIGMNTDITERKKAEDALITRERHLAAIIKASPNAILVVNDEGRYIDANPAAERIFGLPVDKLLGTRISDFMEPGFNFDQVWTQFKQSGHLAPSQDEVRIVRADGEVLDVVVSSVANVLPGLHLAVHIDVTEHNQMLNALTQAKEDLRKYAEKLEKMVEERTARLQEVIGDLEHFSFTVSHDMRAPLRGIRGFSEMMLESGCANCNNSMAKDLLKRIVSGANRMDMLITDAVEYSRAVNAKLQVLPVDVAALLREMLCAAPNLQPAFADITLQGDFPKALGNETALNQCFGNLLANAVKYVQPGVKPRIRIWAEKEDEWVRICVEDNGIGIPQEFQPKMFQMFQRVSNKYEGTGIGLALVRKNMEKMGGTAGVESQAGKGSRFWLKLKLAPLEFPN